MFTERIPNSRAAAISKALIRTGRAANPKRMHGFVYLEARAGGFYWIADNGFRILRGDSLADAEDLQPTFVEAMARSGRQGAKVFVR